MFEKWLTPLVTGVWTLKPEQVLSSVLRYSPEVSCTAPTRPQSGLHAAMTYLWEVELIVAELQAGRRRRASIQVGNLRGGDSPRHWQETDGLSDASLCWTGTLDDVHISKKHQGRPSGRRAAPEASFHHSTALAPKRYRQAGNSDQAQDTLEFAQR